MQPYFQTTPYTTAAAALLTILHHFRPEIPLSKEQEFDIWKKTVNLPTRACSIYALALYAQQRGLRPKVIVENTAYSFPDYRFYHYTKEDVEQAAFSSRLYLKEAKKNNVPLEQREIQFSEIKKYLKNHLLLLRVNAKSIRGAKRNVSNYIVVHGHTERYYHIIDPAFAALSIPEQVLQEAFESLETKKYRDHRMIVF